MNYAENGLGLSQSSEEEIQTIAWLCFTTGVAGSLQWSHCWNMLCSKANTLLDFI